MIRWLLFALIVVPIVYLLMFGLGRSPREIPSALIGKEAPPFVLQTLDDKEVRLADFKGRPMVINFWATWCTPCLYEHSVLKEARATHEQKGVAFLGVVYQDSRGPVTQYIKELGEPFLVLFDASSKMAIDYGVGGVPETFFVDPQGVIRKKFQGVLTRVILDREIKELSGSPRKASDTF